MLTIKPSKHKKLKKLYVDDVFLGAIPESFLKSEFYLNPETEIPSEYLKTIKLYVTQTAKNKLLEYLAKAEKTVYDCKIYLKKNEIPNNIIDYVIKEAQDNKWLSDERYAFFYTEESILNGKSPLEIKHKLMLKRICPKIIDKAIKKFYSKDTQQDVIKEIINNLINRNTELSEDKLFEKIATTLYRKGFSYHQYEEYLKIAMISATD